MRVLHITRDYPPHTSGGLSTAVYGLSTALQELGCQNTIVSFDNYRPKSNQQSREALQVEVNDHGVAILRVRLPSQLPEAQNLALQSAPNLLHLHHEMLWDFASGILQQRALPTIYSVHVLQAKQNQLRNIEETASSKAQDLALVGCDHIHAPSAAVADWLRNASPHLAQKIAVLPLGTLLTPAKTLPAISTLAPYLLYVGRFADINGFSELLHALPALFTKHPTLHAIAAGGMPDSPKVEKRWRKRWQRIAGDAEHRLQFVGWKSAAQLAPLYQNAAMLIVPSWFETFGQVALEGMCYGAPLIVSQTEALRALVGRGSALTIEPQSCSAIGNAVSQLLADPEKTQERRYNALRTSRSYSWRDRALAFLREYKTQLR